MTITSGLAFIEAILKGKIIEDKEVNLLKRRQIWLYIHSHGEATLIIVELISSVERLIGIYFPRFHASKYFKLFFIFIFLFSQSYVIFYIYYLRIAKNLTLFSIAYGSTNIFVVLNLFLLVVLLSSSKKLYLKTRGQLTLRRRYQISATYKLAKCLLPFCLFQYFSCNYCFRLHLAENCWDFWRSY
ncbi:unnamed protein product [Caenorhabditis angaria]|uniref:Uncharacterized protein n=1 Tax=Caenorhabditis angaria TaxID=860376 RepID=A0A9P1ITR1_9PELO|nr:unnamed protein product [Caenorhabditis angaria]